MERTRLIRRGIAGALVLAALAASPAGAAPTPEPFRSNDFGGFNAVLPPGTNGLDNALQLANFLATGARPPHNNDQYAAYEDLVYAPKGLTAAQIPNYFHDASFGVPSGQVERQYSPRSDVTVQRDSLGVPHVYGETRAGAMFGLGYIGAEDRLFFMDALRNAGRAQLSTFVGGAEGNREMDEDVWAETPYTEQDLQRQCDYNPKGFEAAAAQLRQDVTNYVAGINQYISEARLDPSKMPGEYAAINRPQGPEDWQCTDVISTAALVGGIFGKGGGHELDSALVLQAARRKFGAKVGKQVWKDFRNAEDPEAPTTVHSKRFPYGAAPRNPRGVVLPDPGSVDKTKVVVRSTAPATRDDARHEGILAPLSQLGEDGLRAGASNALLVSARESEGGKPTAVMGPQVAYFSPQILLEQDVHAPTLDARGAAFPGVNLFVLLGRGRDYAWSATSAGQDIIDTFAVPLCDPNGGNATMASTGYRFRGQCLPFEVLTRTISWLPSPADQTPPGSETLRTLRSKLGVEIARARVKGKPYAFTKLRSTYFHEADSAIGFSSFNNPAAINGPKDFQQAASLIGFTFNWLYADDENIAYLNSGWNPKRAKRTDSDLPISSKFPWRGYQSDFLSGESPFPSKITGIKRHPQIVNQNFISSWNNKQAPAYHASDENWSYGPTYRSVTLDERIRKLIKGKRKASLPELIEAMIGAATVDLRGHTVLPYALKVMRSEPIANPALRNAVSQLSRWAKSGAHRIDSNRDGNYEHADAIKLLDAWWEPLLRAEFQRRLGKGLFDAIENVNLLDDTPNLHLGSAYNGGWYVYANKDLRTLLAKQKGRRALRRIKGRDSRIYCGRGKLSRCRDALLDSLQSVLGKDPYGQNANCGVGSRQMCFDAIEFRSTGGVTQPDMTWMNRPTFQQAVQIQGHR
ncbi:MAG: penicillin acylase family protein [Actinomycetota bacterium]